MENQPYIVAIGCNAIDEYYQADFFPVAGDKALMVHTDSIPGGMIPNAAAVMSRLGAPCYILDTLGDDKDTKVLMDDMERYGLRTDYVEIISGAPNNKTMIVLAGTEKTILVVTPTEKPFVRIDHDRQQLLNKAAYVYTIIPDLKNIANYETLVETFTSHDAKLVLDAENSTFTNQETERFFFDHASILIFNEHSFDKFCGDVGVEAVKTFIGESERLVVLTLGGDGCRIFSRDEDFSLPAYKLQPVDVTGAGDTFNGAFLYGLTQQWDLRKCATFATAAAARAVLYKGARSGAESVDTILNFMKKGGQ